MTAPPDDTTTDLHAVIATLRAERDAAVARQAARDSDYTERVAYQGATVEVLRAMAASPGDPKPVFEVIVRRARDLCDAYSASLAHVVDSSIVLRAYVIGDEAEAKQHEASFPRPIAADTMFGRAILAREPIQLPDVAADQTYALREGTLRGGVRAQAAVPLMRDGEALGAINITRRQTGEFSRAQIELLQTFAEQAVIAITSAETFRKLREALEQQTATAEVLQVINSSPGDLAPVFDALLEKAMWLCGAAFGSLYTYDGKRFHSAAQRGVPPAYAAYRAENPPLLSTPGGAPTVLLETRRPVHVLDMRAHETNRPEFPNVRAMVELGGIRTSLAVPLIKDDAFLGFITIYRQEVRAFSDKQISLLENFAAQAVIAMENARLLTETREALEQQTATAEVLQVINASPGDLTPVFDAILEKAHRLCGGVFGRLLIREGDEFHLAAAHGEAQWIETVRQTHPWRPPEDSPLVRLVSGERIVHIPDVRVTDHYANASPQLRHSLDSGSVRTSLFVPLRKDGALLGAITASRPEIRPFTDKQIALLENFAAQAVIAMENARLLTETRDALEQQTATAEVLQVINASPGDLTPVFDAMLEKATRLCQAEMGTLWTYDGEYMQPAAMRGAPPPFAEFLKRGPHRPNSAQSRILRGERVIHSVNTPEGEAYRSGDPLARAAADLGGIRTILVVSLRKDEAVRGTIGVYRQEVRPFSDKQIALLQNFAAQAVIAMENARLLTETREALEQQTATTEVLQVINSSPGDLAPVFDAILEKAHSLCGAPLGSLVLRDGDQLRAVATRGHPQEYETLARQGFPPNPPFRLFLSGEPFVHVPEPPSAWEDHPMQRAAAEISGVRTVLWVPLRKDETVLGYISASRQEVRPFTDKQIALLQNFAAQAVIAIENARLLTETREALEQQTATAEVLQVINSSPGDLAPVFEAILEKAHTLCGATLGSLIGYDGEFFHRLAAHGYPPEYEALIRTPFRPLPDMGQRLLDGERFIHDADLALRSSDSPFTRTAVESVGIRTALFVPLRKDGTLLGYISAQRREVRPFSDREIALIENFAAQAVIAMENARLLGELRQRTDEVAELNRGLEARVAEQVEELGRVGRLKRFLAPQLAELIVSQDNEKILESHRREIVVVFCDLRGYTAFAETAEPEEVLDFLRDYHGALGPLVARFEGTLDQFSGDGIMVFFNDPVPCADPAERAVKMAMAMREAAGALLAKWRRRGRELGFGAGIAQGYATLGQIGFAERSGYTAIGTVCNLAARLCAEAKDGQILVAQRVAIEVEKITTLEEIGALALKGLTQPVVAFNVPLVGSQAAFRVIEGGPPSV